jgi:DNA-binding response OmpR family regulator
VEMPVMNGLDFLQALRSRPQHWSRTPVILVSAAIQYVQTDEVPAQAFFPKPAPVEALLAKIRFFISEASSVRTPRGWSLGPRPIHLRLQNRQLAGRLRAIAGDLQATARLVCSRSQAICARTASLRPRSSAVSGGRTPPGV